MSKNCTLQLSQLALKIITLAPCKSSSPYRIAACSFNTYVKYRMLFSPDFGTEIKSFCHLCRENKKAGKQAGCMFVRFFPLLFNGKTAQGNPLPYYWCTIYFCCSWKEPCCLTLKQSHEKTHPWMVCWIFNLKSCFHCFWIHECLV